MLKEELAAATGVADLEKQAKEAFDLRRTRECVTLTKAILKADPENAQGLSLQSALQREMQRDLDDATTLLEDSLSQGEGQKYRKAAEIILLKVIFQDPDNEQAKALLAKAKGSAPASSAAAQPSSAEAHPAREEEVPFTAAPSLFDKSKEKNKKRSLKVPIIIFAAAALVTAIILLNQSRSTVQGATPQPHSAAQPARLDSSETRSKSGDASPVAVGLTTTPSTGPGAVLTGATSASPNAGATPAKPDISFDSDRPVAFVEAGTLTVSSPAGAEIYMEGKRLGATPISLQLLAGKRTLEYRHGELRTVVTHNIKSNQTTTAVVNFDVTIQINARPWAQVFVDGTTKRALGQTPLSDVKVPLGSVLVFENPNFPSKSVRVTDADSAIQVAFP